MLSKSNEARAACSERARIASTPSAARGDAVMTIRQWCELNNFSLATGGRILKRGEGPPVLQLSLRRKGIRVSDNDRWQESRLRSRPGEAS